MSIDWYNTDGKRPAPPAGEGYTRAGQATGPDDFQDFHVMVWRNVPEEILSLLPTDLELGAIIDMSVGYEGHGNPRYREHLRLMCAYARASYLDRDICKGCGSLTHACDDAIAAGAIKCCPDCSHHGYVPQLAELEKAHILKVMGTHSDNKTLAAKVLGIDRRTLYRKLKQYETEH